MFQALVGVSVILSGKVSLSLEKDKGKQYSVIAFSKAISTFLNENIFSFKDNTHPSKRVDFQLSPNWKLVVKVKQRQSESDENVIG